MASSNNPLILLLFICLIAGSQMLSAQPFTGDYRSNVASGNWNVAGSWETFNGSIWVAAVTPPTGGETIITVRAGHNIIIPAPGNPTFTVSGQLDIQATGTLTIQTGPVPALTKLTLTGTINNSGTITVTGGGFNQIAITSNGGTLNNSGTINNSIPAKIVFNGTSVYDHIFTASAGVIPTATWASTSTCRITSSFDLAPSGLGQTFGNFEWNYPTQTAFIDLGGALTTVNGDLRLITNQFAGMTLNGAGGTYNLNIGGSLICYEYFEFNNLSGTTTVNVTGNVTVDDPNGSFSGYLVLNSGTGQTNLNVTGNILIDNSAGGFAAVDMSFGNSGSTSIVVNGNYTTQNGAFLTYGFGMGTYNLSFGGTMTQTVTESNPLDGINIIINSNAIVSIPDGGGTNFLGTDQSFTTGTNSVLRVGSTNANGAIQTGTSNGNIRVSGSRTYASNSTIEYNGASQFIGNGHPTTSGVNTIINNSSGNTTLAVDATIGGNLTLTTGNLVIPAGRTLTMNGTFTPGANSLNVTSTSNIVVGNAASAFGTLVTTGSSTINNLTINRSGQPFIIGNDLRIDGTFTHDASSVNFDNRTLTIGNNYTPTSGSLVGNASSTLIITGLGTVGVIPLSGTLGTLTIDQPSGVVNTTSVTIATALNVLTGTYSGAGSVSLSNGATVTRRDGTITKSLTAAGTYNLVYTNTSAINTGNELITSPSTALNNVTVNGANTVTLNAALTSVTVNGALTLSTGIFNSNSKDIEFRGNIVSNATGTFTGSSLTFSGTTTLSGGVALVLPNIIIATGGTLNLGSGTVDFTGNIDHDNLGSLNPGTGTARFSGTSTVTCDVNNVPRFNNLQILTGATMAINCVSADCGTAPSQYGIEVAGNWNSNNSGSTFTPNQSRVVLNGVTQSISSLPSHSFYGLQLLGTGTTTLSNSLRVNNNFILGQNATLNTGSSQPINIGGDFLVNGTFIPNQGTVTFNGTGTQKIDRTLGSGAVNKDFYNITVNKSGGLFNVVSTVANTSFRVSNEFRISQNGSAPIDVDFDGPSNTGMLILRSTATATARIPSVPSPTTIGIQGNLTVERYIQNDDGTRAWRYFASPVVNNTPPSANGTIADWQQEIAITGQFSNPTTGPGIIPSAVSLYRWVETNGGVESNRYSPWPNNVSNAANTFALTNGAGYSVFVRNQANPVLNSRGTLRFGDVNIGLTRTGSEANAAGYNLVGNPYPAPLDWDLVSLPGTVSSTISMLDNVNNANLGAGQFVYYVQGGPNIGNFTGVIASGQAFWVELTSGSSATLTLTESHKASDLNPVVVREKSIANVLRVKLYGTGSNDETAIYFNDAATSSYDFQYDARKLVNQNINLYSFVDSDPGTKYAINGLENIACSQSVKLGIMDLDTDFLPNDPDQEQIMGSGLDITPAGNYTLEFSDLETFINDYEFTLVDKYLGLSVNIIDQNTYDFEITEDLNSRGDNRFEVIISKAEVDSGKLINTSDVCSGSNANIEILNAEEGITYYASIGGSVVSEVSLGTGNDLSITVADSKLTNGENNLIVYGQRPGCDAVPMSQQVRITKEPLYQVNQVTNGLLCNAGSTTLAATGAPASASYRWYEGNSSDPIEGADGAQFTTPVLEKTKSYYVSVVNSLGCESDKKLVKAEVVNFDNVMVEINDNRLESNYSAGNQWYLDGNIILGATGQIYTPVESGFYEVKVDFGQCSDSAGRQFTVTALEDSHWLDGQINIYPNPVKNLLTIEFNNVNLSNPRIIDVMGREVGKIAIEVNQNSRMGNFDFSAKAQGIYLLQITDEKGKVYSKRIIKN